MYEPNRDSIAKNLYVSFEFAIIVFVGIRVIRFCTSLTSIFNRELQRNQGIVHPLIFLNLVSQINISLYVDDDDERLCFHHDAEKMCPPLMPRITQRMKMMMIITDFRKSQQSS